MELKNIKKRLVKEEWHKCGEKGVKLAFVAYS